MASVTQYNKDVWYLDNGTDKKVIFNRSGLVKRRQGYVKIQQKTGLRAVIDEEVARLNG